MKKIIFIAKTNLDNDGRILNQIKILQDQYKNNLDLHFLLLPDQPYNENLGLGVKIHNLDSLTRNNKFLRIFTVVEFTRKVLKKLSELNAEIIHVQDLAVVLPAYIYKKYYGKNVTVIYDDHEMPNENESWQYKLFQRYERKLMKIADFVIYANEERQEILDKKFKIKNSSYFLNLPYYEENEEKIIEIEQKFKDKLNQLYALKRAGSKLIIHQGLLEVERGRRKLADFSKLNLINTKIVIIGIKEHDFADFVQEYKLNRDNFLFIGSVPYKILAEFWKVADAAIIMYLPTFINNRLCAPNRYFIALKFGIPTIVNKDNPVLFNFTEKYKSGFYIEDIKTDVEIEKVIQHTYYINTLDKLKDAEIEKFKSIYEKFI